MNNTAGVIIRCYNQSNEIADIIWSILDQDYHNKNIVVIDDGSTDNSWQVICKSLYRPDRAEDFEFKQTINNTYCFAKQNEFEDGLLRTLYEGAKHFWDSSDWFGITSDGFSAGKISICMGESDENLGYIYTDYIQDNFLIFEQSNRPTRIDTGFFNKNVLENIDINKIEDEAHFLRTVISNFLTFHIPEGL